MPSIKLLREAVPELSKLSDFELADAYAEANGIPNEYARLELGLEQRNQTFTEDLGTAAKQGLYRLPGIAAGIADIPFAAVTGERPYTRAANYLGDLTGFQPGKWADQQEALLSNTAIEARKPIEEAWRNPNVSGLAAVPGIARAYFENPTGTLLSISESVPSMFAGGALGRVASGLGAARGAGAFTPAAEAAGAAVGPVRAAVPGVIERVVGQSWAPAAAAGVGEGSIMAGQAMAGYDPDLPDQRQAALISAGIGLGGGVLGAVGGRLATRFGLADVDVLLASGSPVNLLKTAAKRPLSFTGRVAGGAVAEGVFEEAPQSALETMGVNLMNNRPIGEGVARSMVEGGLAGGLMGGTLNLRTSRSRGDWAKDIKAAQAVAADQSVPYSDREQAAAFLQQIERGDVTSGIQKKYGITPAVWATADSLESDRLARIEQIQAELAAPPVSAGYPTAVVPGGVPSSASSLPPATAALLGGTPATSTQGVSDGTNSEGVRTGGNETDQAQNVPSGQAPSGGAQTKQTVSGTQTEEGVDPGTQLPADQQTSAVARINTALNRDTPIVPRETKDAVPGVAPLGKSGVKFVADALRNLKTKEYTGPYQRLYQALSAWDKSVRNATRQKSLKGQTERFPALANALYGENGSVDAVVPLLTAMEDEFGTEGMNAVVANLKGYREKIGSTEVQPHLRLAAAWKMFKDGTLTSGSDTQVRDNKVEEAYLAELKAIDPTFDAGSKFGDRLADTSTGPLKEGAGTAGWSGAKSGLLNMLSNQSWQGFSPDIQTLSRTLYEHFTKTVAGRASLPRVVISNEAHSAGIHVVGEWDDSTNTITLYKGGHNARTLIHELLHAATVGYIRANPNSPATAYMEKTLTLLAKMHDGTAKGSYVKFGAHTKGMPEGKLARLNVAINNTAVAYKNAKTAAAKQDALSEFIAYATTDPDFQNYLKALELKNVSDVASKQLGAPEALSQNVPKGRTKPNVNSTLTLWSRFTNAMSWIITGKPFSAENMTMMSQFLSDNARFMNELSLDAANKAAPPATPATTKVAKTPSPKTKGETAKATSKAKETTAVTPAATPAATPAPAPEKIDIGQVLKAGDRVTFQGKPAVIVSTFRVSGETRYNVRFDGDKALYQSTRENVTLVKSALRSEQPKDEELTMDVDKAAIAQLMGRQLYGNTTDSGEVAVKELFQNSFDALKGAIEDGSKTEGKISILIDEDKRSITVTDDGVGMSITTVRKALFTLAGSVKTTKRPSGGFGIAKMQFLSVADKINVDTVKDGVRVVVSTTGAEVVESFNTGIPLSKGSMTTQDTKLPNGTTVSITLPESHEDQNGDTVPIELPSSNIYSAPRALKDSPLFDNIVVEYGSKSSSRPLDIGANFPKDDYVPLATVKFSWGTARLIATKEKNSFAYTDNVSVLSNGVWQFYKTLKTPGLEGEYLPYDFYLNLESAVEAKSPDYPIAMNRKGFSISADRDMTRLFQVVGAMYAHTIQLDHIAYYGELKTVTADGTFGDSVDLKQPVPQEQLDSSLQIPKDAKIEIIDGVMKINGKVIPEMTQKELETFKTPSLNDFQLSQDKFSAKAMYVHDGAEYEIDGKFVPASEYGMKKFGPQFADFMHDFTGLLHDIRDLMATMPGYGGLKGYPTGAMLQYSTKGTTFGVHLAKPFKAIFVNPLEFHVMEPTGDMVEDRAVAAVSTMVHEVAHLKQMNHSPQGFVPAMQQLFTQLGRTHPDAINTWTESMKGILAQYEDIIEGFAKVPSYERRTLGLHLDSDKRQSSRISNDERDRVPSQEDRRSRASQSSGRASGVSEEDNNQGGDSQGEVRRPLRSETASYLDDSNYFYHAVRNDADIDSIVKNGLRAGTNVSSLGGQAFEDEGGTVLVFERSGARLAGKGYQGDEVVQSSGVKPVAILKDTSVDINTVDEEAYNKLGDQYNALEKRAESYAKTLGITADQFWETISTRRTDELGNLGDQAKAMGREQDKIFRQMDEYERSSEKGNVTEQDVLSKYEKYGLPVQKLTPQPTEGSRPLRSEAPALDYKAGDNVTLKDGSEGTVERRRPVGQSGYEILVLTDGRRVRSDEVKPKLSRPLRSEAPVEDVDTSRRNFVIGMAATLASSQVSASDLTIGKAVPVSEAILSGKVSKAMEGVLRGGRADGQTNVNGAEALRRVMGMIAESGPKELRALAAKIKATLPTTGIRLRVDDTGQFNVSGVVALGPPARMTLYTAQGRDGLSYSTVIHETLHVGLLAKYISLGAGVVRSNDRLMGMDAPQAAKAMAQFKDLWYEFRAAAKDAKGLDARTELAVSEATDDMEEFFVRALTDPYLQKFMAGVEYKGRTLYERFKDWVKSNLFGFNKTGTAPSWLDAALAASNDLLDASIGDASDFGRVEAYLRIKNKSQPNRNKLAEDTSASSRPLRSEAPISVDYTPNAKTPSVIEKSIVAMLPSVYGQNPKVMNIIEDRASDVADWIRKHSPGMAAQLQKIAPTFNIPVDFAYRIGLFKRQKGSPLSAANDMYRFLKLATPDKMLSAFAYMEDQSKRGTLTENERSVVLNAKEAIDKLVDEASDDIKTRLGVASGEKIRYGDIMTVIAKSEDTLAHGFGLKNIAGIARGEGKPVSIEAAQVDGRLNAQGEKDKAGRFYRVAVGLSNTGGQFVHESRVASYPGIDLNAPYTFDGMDRVATTARKEDVWKFAPVGTARGMVAGGRTGQEVGGALLNTIAIIANANAVRNFTEYMANNPGDHVFDSVEAVGKFIGKKPTDAPVSPLQWGSRDAKAQIMANQYRRPGEWVQLPTSDTLGGLSGKVVSGPLWAAIQDASNRKPLFEAELYNQGLSAFKQAVTVYNPPTVLGNFLSNFALAHLNDIKYATVATAINLYRRYKLHPESLSATERKIMSEFMQSGAILGDWSTSEGRQLLYEALTEKSETKGKGFISEAMEWMNAHSEIVRKISQKAKTGAGYAERAHNIATDIYSAGDNVFRLAAFMSKMGELQRNGTMERKDMLDAAGAYAKDVFLDYDIDSRYLQVLKQTLLPFASFTYAATKRYAQIAKEKPWKLAELALIYQIVSMAAAAATGDSEEEDKRKRKRDNKDARTWFGAYQNIRLPSAYGKTNYLELARWMPTPFSTKDLPNGFLGIGMWPQSLTPSSPVISILAASFGYNVYTGRRVDKETDSDMMKFNTRITEAVKGVIPAWMRKGLPSPGPLGEKPDTTMFVAGSLLAPVTSVNDREAKYRQTQNIKAVEREFKTEESSLKKKKAAGRIDASEYRNMSEALKARNKKRMAEARGVD